MIFYICFKITSKTFHVICCIVRYVMSLDRVPRKSSNILFLLKIASICSGVALDPKQKKMEIAVRYFISLCFFSVGLASIVEFLRVPHSKSELMEIIYTTNACISLLSVLYVITKNKNKLRSLYIKIEENYYQSIMFATTSNNFVLNIIRKYRLIVLYIYLLVTVLPFLITCTTEVEAGNMKSLIFPCWYPWNTSTELGYVFTMIVQLLTVTFAYVMFGSLALYVSLFIVSILVFIQQFENDLLSVYEIVSNESIKNPRKKYDTKNQQKISYESVDREKKIKMKLSAVINRHTFLMK